MIPLEDIKPIKKSKKELKNVVEIERINPEIEQGLTYQQVEERILAGLSNKVSSGSTKTVPSIVISNIMTLFNLMNIGIATWLITVGAFKDLFFIVIVSLNVGIGIFQEIRAKKTIDKLSLLSAPTGVVIRDGEEQEIMISDLVIDDLMKLATGKQISADSVVREGQIEVNESLLTGESDPIVKKVGDELFSGSFVVSGHCVAQVTKIGKESYIENLAKQAKKYRKPKSDLLKSLRNIIRTVGFLIIPIGGTLFYMQIHGGAAYNDAVRGVAGAVIGMIPSGLFLLTSVTLAVGVLRLAQNNTLVQELYCIEMLARIDTLCLDKTGTITDGTMAVKSVIEYVNPSGLPIKKAIPTMMASLEEKNLTSEALEQKFGTTKRIKTKAVIPFSSARKLSAVEFEKYGTFALGAPEFVLKKDAYADVAADVEKNAKEGYRVIAIAHSAQSIDGEKLPSDIKAIGLVVIEDTIRPDAIVTIEYFKTHNVDVKVISGDNPMTVAHISKRAGIEDADKFISLEGVSDKDVIRYADKYTVFGRVSPTQKKLLIESLKRSGRTVAMTGDGVNDILALKEADTSIAMASGSEAARNVSHLVLMDSNFSSMPKVVNEGRRVINNVQRVAILFLTKTIFSFMLSMVAILSRGIYPITPSQLSMIDFLVIGLPSFFLALEPNTNQVKGRFLLNVLKRALPGALVVVINVLIIFALTPILQIDKTQSSTLIVISATFTAMMVLLRVLKPMNMVRTILFGVMFTAFIAATIFAPDFFEFNSFFRDYYSSSTGALVPRLPVEHILLLIVLVQTAYPAMGIIANIPGYISKAIKFVLMKLSSI